MEHFNSSFMHLINNIRCKTISFTRDELLNIRQNTPQNLLPDFDYSDVLLNVVVGGAAALINTACAFKRLYFICFVSFQRCPSGGCSGTYFIFFVYSINNFCDNILNAGTICMQTTLLFIVKSVSQALHYLQSAFDIVQFRLCQLKLVLNTDKTSLMFFF